MKHIIILLLLLPFTMAVEVGLYIQHSNNDVEFYCLDVAQDADGFELLSQVNSIDMDFFDTTYIVCSVGGRDANQICEPSSDRAWRLFLQDNGKFHDEDLASLSAGDECYTTDFNTMANFIFYSFDTHTFSNARYCAQQGDVLALVNTPFPTGRPTEPDWKVVPSHNSICNPISITDIDVQSGSRNTKSVDEDGDDFNAESNQELDMDILVENNGNVEVEIEFTADLYDDEDEDTVTIRPGDDKRVSIKLDTPNELDDYDLELSYKAFDEFGNDYEDSIDFEVTVKNPEHKLKLNRFTVDKCGEIQITLENTGDDDEDAAVRIYNDDRSVDISEGVIILEEDTEQITAIAEIGVYNLQLAVQYQGDDIRESKKVEIEDCNPQVTTKAVEALAETKIEPAVKPKTQVPAKQVVTATTVKKGQNPAVFMLIGFIVLLIVIIVIIGLILLVK